MRKVYTLLFAFMAIVSIANAQATRRVLRWSAPNMSTSNFDITSTTTSNAASFTNSNNWRVVNPTTGAVTSTTATPASFDTLQIYGATVRLGIDLNLTGLQEIVIMIGAPRSGQAYTFRVNENFELLLHSTAKISVLPTGVVRAQRDNFGVVDTWIKIGGVTKLLANSSADDDVTGPAQATSSSPVTTTSAQEGFRFGALPVVLVGFDAVKQNNAVNITWSTQQEFNTDFFSVERSFDGANYTSIGKVAAAGNATTPRSYSYSDAAPSKGIAYYRVRIVDMDGKVGFTTVKAIRAVASGAKVSVYPNPAVSVANIVVNNNDNQAFSLNVFNRNGQLVSQKRASAGTTAVALEVAGMPAGDYIIDVNFADGSRQSSKLVVGKQ